MRIISFPGCCTAKVVTGFGQEHAAEYSYRPSKEYTVDSFISELDELIRGYSVGLQNGVLVATITSRQTTAEKAFAKMGFIGSGWLDKDGHRDTKLQLFHINPKKYIESDAGKAIYKEMAEYRKVEAERKRKEQEALAAKREEERRRQTERRMEAFLRENPNYRQDAIDSALRPAGKIKDLIPEKAAERARYMRRANENYYNVATRTKWTAEAARIAHNPANFVTLGS